MRNKEWVWKDRIFSQYGASPEDVAIPEVKESIIEHAVDQLSWNLNELKEQAIQMAIQKYSLVTVTQPFEVKITRPWWMPLRVHRWLFRQVVLFEGKEMKFDVSEHEWEVDDE